MIIMKGDNFKSMNEEEEQQVEKSKSKINRYFKKIPIIFIFQTEHVPTRKTKNTEKG